MLDGLLYGSGDAVIGINPATDNVPQVIDAARRCWTTSSAQLRHPDAVLRADPCHHHDRGHRTAARRSIWCSSRSPAPRPPTRSFGINLALLREARDAALSLKRGTRRRQRDVFRDRPGQRAVGQRASRRRPADLRGARLRGGAPVQAAAGQYRGRLHRPGIPVRRQADHPRRAGGPFLRQAARACRWAATSATPTTPRPTRTTWTCC